MCEHHFIHTSHSRVCNQCGLEERMLRLDTFNTYSAPLCKGYQREVRFRQKIDKLISLQNPPAVTSPVWDYIKSKKPLFTPSDVRKALRTYTGKNKHYDCIRLFTRVFTPFRVRIKCCPDRLYEQLTRQFSSLIRLWGRYNVDQTMPFFSYDFLLRYFLEKLGSPLVVYCKPVTCKKRHLRNNERLVTILALDDDGMYCQNSGVDHFQSEKRSSENHPCPRRLVDSRELGVEGQGATCHGTRPLGG